MSKAPLPCCPDARARHLLDPGHLYQFDFDLYECERCRRPWVWAWSPYGQGWEPVTAEDAARMLAMPAEELRPFMRQWADAFD